MNIQDLASKSGDSYLKSYNFSDGILEICLDVDYFDEEITIHIPTHLVLGESILSKDKITRNCRIELTQLEDELNSEKDCYIPASDFGAFMKEVRAGASLAYGKKKSEVKWKISIVGYSRLISCLTGDLGKISVSLAEDISEIVSSRIS
jgi:hypothetical protein